MTKIVEISVHKFSYKIPCQEGDEEKINRLAQILDARMSELLNICGEDSDEKTLLIMSALKAQEELLEKENEESDQFSGDDVMDAISDNIENIASYIEQLTKKIYEY